MEAILRKRAMMIVLSETLDYEVEKAPYEGCLKEEDYVTVYEIFNTHMKLAYISGVGKERKARGYVCVVVGEEREIPNDVMESLRETYGVKN